ncbi:hypothetical protein Cgig2_015481 [Carnegiea gigantea]|uniref:Uncharacterized protein n=1 Tax=Carnegiea gigantea TaxID=171969 RepID=A0A9Q1GLH8_9CARY|nr:hypothetical protein Cgig2_015481 [Carnegiea gigantea]
MSTAFLLVASALRTPPYFAAMVLLFLSNLMGGLTHYGMGSAPVFYGANYVPLGKWWGYGFLISVFINILIWLGVGRIYHPYLRRRLLTPVLQSLKPATPVSETPTAASRCFICCCGSIRVFRQSPGSLDVSQPARCHADESTTPVADPGHSSRFATQPEAQT